MRLKRKYTMSAIYPHDALQGASTRCPPCADDSVSVVTLDFGGQDASRVGSTYVCYIRPRGASRYHVRCTSTGCPLFAVSLVTTLDFSQVRPRTVHLDMRTQDVRYLRPSLSLCPTPTKYTRARHTSSREHKMAGYAGQLYCFALQRQRTLSYDTPRVVSTRWQAMPANSVPVSTVDLNG